MPELPEVQSLVDFLRQHAIGKVVASVELGNISVLKTYQPAPSALAGLAVTQVQRHGKFIDIDADGLHLVFHLAKAGWLRWYDQVPDKPLRPGKAPQALRVRLSDPEAQAPPCGFDLTEAGTKKRLAVYIVTDPQQVPGIANLGPDPLAADFNTARLTEILTGQHKQLKGLLRDQAVLAGVGNAYSDEVLHAAQLSPFAMSDSLAPQEVSRLHDALCNVLGHAIEAASGKPAAELKDAKRAGMAVHGRTGQPCPVCGDVVREVSFADSSFQYCATCQTGGKILADRRMSRLIK